MGIFSGPKPNGHPGAALERVLQRPGGVPMQELRELFGISSWYDLVPRRPGAGGTLPPQVSPDQAMRNSAVWACLRLRADLVSTLPVGVWRDTVLPDGSKIPTAMATPPVLTTPGGDLVGLPEWLYSSQIDLDRVGNAIGIIRETDGNGLPSRIDLQLTQNCSIVTSHGVITEYKIGGVKYPPAMIWHEKQFTIAGLPVGLSPVMYAALTLGRYASIEQFATAWFSGGGVPRARLRNTAKKINNVEATNIKEAWRASIAVGEPFVTGNDWEYDLIQAEHASADWLEAQKAGVVDIARYFGCPADLIDAAIATGTNITYANVTQRNLQFLIMHLRPALRRREWALSGGLLARPRYIKFDTNDFLEMDPLSRIAWIKDQIAARVLSPDEGRDLLGRAPLTQAQTDQLLTFFPPKGTVLAGTGETAPAQAPPSGTDTPAGG